MSRGVSYKYAVSCHVYTYISNSIRKDILLLTDVPEIISVDNKVYYLQYSDSFAGDVFMILKVEKKDY